MTGAPLRVGVIGASYAATAHLPVYAVLPEVEVTAIATAHRDTARSAAERFGIPAAYDDYAELCRSPDVDLVDVATRPRLHPPMALAALRAGKHVLCEAPLAADVAGGEELVAAARAAGTVAAVDMQSRFSLGLWQLRRLVHDGWLGRLENVHATAFYPTFTRPERAASSLWCADAENGASSLRVHGLHTADVIGWVFGPLTDVTGVAARRRPDWPAPTGPPTATSADSAVLAGRIAGGAPCSVHTSWTAWHGSGWRLDAYGRDGRVTARAAGHTGHHPVTLHGARWDAESLDRIDPPQDADEVPEIASDAPGYPFARLVRHLAVTARAGTPDPDLPTFADGLELLRLAEALTTD